MTVKMHDYLQKQLEHLFQYKNFRSGQEEIITSCLQGENVVALLPTGAGKSICYQLPARITEGLTIVISPLLSLMEDQINELLLFGEKRAQALNSMRSFEERKFVYEHMPYLKLLFVSPEMLQSEKLMNALKSCEVSRIVIDEAHCITQWGHEFRRDYRKLGQVVNQLGKPPVLALTATASNETLQDIIQVLQIEGVSFHLHSMNRSNIALSIKKVKDENEKLTELLSIVKKLKGNGIIYCNSRAMTEGLFQYLSNNGIAHCAFYHGGIHSEQRLLLQNQFRQGQIKILIATSAFGMGINKKDIRYVVHYGIPPFLENYMQEIGRAGRDNEAALAHMIYTESDIQYAFTLVERELPNEQTCYEVLQAIHTVTNKASIWDDEWLYHFLLTHSISETHWRYIISLLEEFGVIENKLIKPFDVQSIYKQFIEVRKERIYNKGNEVNKILEVAKQLKCVRQTMLSYFGETLEQPVENCCSYCGIELNNYFGNEEDVEDEGSWDKRLLKILHLTENDLSWGVNQ